MITSIIIFAVVYICIATEVLDKTVAVVIGAALMLAFKLISFHDAVSAVDMNVIFLLVGMMLAVFVLGSTGFFEWVAITVAKKTKGNAIKMLIYFLAVTAFFSAFLDNVTTVILLAPVTILIAQLLEISPVPFLILEAISSNMGGAATLIGDPPNIIIGSQVGLSFNDFITDLAPCILIVLVVMFVTVWLLFRKHWSIEDNIRNRVIDSVPELAILNKTKMIKALSIMGLIIVGFFLHSFIEVDSGIIALLGGVVMIVVCGMDVEEVFSKVEWSVIFFFIGLFMLVAGLEENGVITLLAGYIIKFAGHNIFLLSMFILIGSAVFSAVFDNIPFVMAMIPLIQDIIVTVAPASASAPHDPTVRPLWWALALGSCLGGNGTLVGASANVVVSKISSKNNYPISFMRFTRYGFPFMVQSIIISALYIWIRYF